MSVRAQENERLVVIDDVHKRYRLPRRRVLGPRPTIDALRGVSFDVERGRSLGIVGESGCGKSTLARIIMGLEAPSAGRVEVFGQPSTALNTRHGRAGRKRLQIVFQDPFASLDPRMRIWRTVAEPLQTLDRMSRAAVRARVTDSLEAVGLSGAHLDRFPHEFSGGQRQRIAIARALITRPDLVVADEPVSALDVSVQAQVLNLLLDLRDQFGLTYILISHDLAVVDYVCDDLIVMYQGRIVEQGNAAEIYARPRHEYTRTLLGAAPPLPI